MLSALIVLTLTVVADPEPMPLTLPKAEMPTVVDGLAPLKPLASQTPLIRPVLTSPMTTSAPPSLNLPVLPRTPQFEPSAPANPFFGRRSGDFATVRGPSSLPETTGTVARVPGYLSHATDLFEKLYMNPSIARDVGSAIGHESRPLPVGRFETRDVWSYDFRSGYPLTGPTAILTNPNNESSLLPAGFRRSEITPTVMVGRSPFPSALSGGGLSGVGSNGM